MTGHLAAVILGTVTQSSGCGVRVLIDHLIYAHPDLDAASLRCIAASVSKPPVEASIQAGARTTSCLPWGRGPTWSSSPRTPASQSRRRRGPTAWRASPHGGLVGWAVAVEDIEAARLHACSHGFDPGPVIDGHREDATGRQLHWRATANAEVAGPIPFLITWGGVPHPAVDAPAGLRLTKLLVEHPRPTQIRTALAAMGIDVEVRQAPRPALVARIAGPNGESELR